MCDAFGPVGTGRGVSEVLFLYVFFLAPSILTFLCRFVEMICNQKSGTFFQATPLVVEIGRAYESQRYEYIRQLREEEERQIMESQQHAS